MSSESEWRLAEVSRRGTSVIRRRVARVAAVVVAALVAAAIVAAIVAVVLVVAAAVPGVPGRA